MSGGAAGGDGVKVNLEAQLGAKGYGHAVVLGPFGGRGGEAEYTAALYDSTGRVWLRSLRGTYAALREEIAQLPRQGPEPSGRR